MAIKRAALQKNPTVKTYPGYLRRTDEKKPAKKLLISCCIIVFLALFGLSARFIDTNTLQHTVQQDETLYSLSQFYGVYLSQLRLANKLPENVVIRVGQQLNIPLHYYIVEAGDTLSEIALKLNINADKLAQLNHLATSDLMLGAVLIIPQKPVENQTYRVQKGDTLSYVSMRFDISQSLLVKINDLENPVLKEGQILALTSSRPTNYRVQKDETLYSIAKKFDITVDQLMQYNALDSADIAYGQELKMFNPVYNILDENVWQPTQVQLQTSAQVALNPSQSKKATDQNFSNITSAYEQAQQLLASYNEEIEAEGTIGNELKDYHIILDAGHGGTDPGAIVERVINNKTFQFIESEYNYDLVMRLYALLKQHGATVSLTVLSPSHTTRDNVATETFINRKDTVLNKKGDAELRGGESALNKRVALVKQQVKSTKAKKHLFISIHMDSTPNTDLSLVAVENNPSQATRNLANAIIEASGRKGKIIEGSYIVVKNNAADAAILYEVRNLKEEVSDIVNSYEYRQKDAESIVNGILKYAKMN